ncbi:hypothetical protein CCY99_08965 [Helicobacter sp. 16-1353]|uniref:UbiX family flavin prenyltransferase n=1 Tax=Helicobacter sp. 16-1353 TaxID=2004996 RepID=UPI000DCB7007|nr:UbiX family flavin prenyltransferase [Helicobacter sp. 16-1353]RAX51493.1 hypothetical protein CCY99_08965 [Helicobacter sp. 16-1353]
MNKKKKLVIAICGASGAELGLKCLSKILHLDYLECYLVLSEGAKNVLRCENNFHFDNFVESLDSNISTNTRLKSTIEILKKYRNRFHIFDDRDLSSPIASGSFGVNAMAIIPCSVNSLAKIAYGISDTLITRSALVCLKEQKKLLLAPREMPLNAIILQNMLTLCNLNVVISPPILGYYSNASSLEDMENFVIGKWLDSLDIENSLYKHWE